MEQVSGPKNDPLEVNVGSKANTVKKQKIVVEYLVGKLITPGIHQLQYKFILTSKWGYLGVEGRSIIENAIIMSFDPPYDPLNILLM
jgi:hypothetical protein